MHADKLALYEHTSCYRFHNVAVGLSSNSECVVRETDRLYALFKVPPADCEMILNVFVRDDDVAAPSNFRIQAVAKETCDCGNFLIHKQVRREGRRNGYRIFEAVFDAEPWDWLGHVEAAIFYFTLRNLRGFLKLHAAAVSGCGTGIVLPGTSGAGKSTIACFLVQDGYKYLSDELALVDHETLELSPFPRCAMVRQEVSHLFSPGTIRTSESTASFGAIKYFAQLQPGDAYTPEMRTSVEHVVFPRYEAGAATRLNSISGREALIRLFEEATIINLTQDPAGCADAMDTAARLVQECTAYSLVWSDARAAVREIRQLVPDVAAGGAEIEVAL